MSLFQYSRQLIAKELTRSTKYFDQLIQISHPASSSNQLVDLLEHPRAQVMTLEQFPSVQHQDTRDAVIMNGNFNHAFDIQSQLFQLYAKMNRHSRLMVILYNPYMAFLVKLLCKLGIRKTPEPTTFITETDLQNICRISGFELVRLQSALFCPFGLGIGQLFNYLLPAIPFIHKFSMVNIAYLRPIVAEKTKPSLSIVIPARNEKGNIENAILRMPVLCPEMEILFVEGNSNDQTWEEILRVKEKYSQDPRFKIEAMKQPGKGKNDAVRVGFQKASGEIVTILDADLTMPPELLGRFYDAYCNGHADFINGSRLVYPMEGEAMRFLNHLGNVFFAKALSYVLNRRIGDSLCGTKLLAKKDYHRIVQWRKDFGDFDPFGDFELLFPSAILAMGVVDIPVRYGARTYGTTNISRFSHGFMLLKMTLIGLFRIRTGKV
jgi:hypothetical protein